MTALRAVAVLFVCAVLARPALAQESALSQALAAFEKAPALRGARVGVLVVDLATGAHLAEHAADEDLVPASNQKLLISAAALDRWGPAHRFETPVLVEGELADGVLDGTLWIVGQGDPSFVSETMWKLAEEIRLAGVREIKGGIGVDTSRFDALRFHPDWEPVSSRAYYAPVSAWSANYSSFRVDVVPGEHVGAPAVLRIAPELPYFRSVVDAMTLRGGGQLALDVDVLPDGSGESVRVSGAVSADRPASTYWRAVGLPERYAAALLRAQLEAQGVHVAARACAWATRRPERASCCASRANRSRSRSACSTSSATTSWRSSSPRCSARSCTVRPRPGRRAPARSAPTSRRTGSRIRR